MESDTDREARLEEIREWVERHKGWHIEAGTDGDARWRAQEAIRKADWLLSEIDRLKAKLEGEDLDWAVFNALKFRTADDDHVYPPDDYGRAICHIDDWAPSEDIRQAWEVVEAMEGHELWIGLGRVRPSDSGDGWIVGFGEDPRPVPVGVKPSYYHARAATAPEAICRATVRWAREDHREAR